MSIRIGILGYGNLGRGVECAIKHNPDLELVAVFTRRAPETVKILTETAAVYSVNDAEKMKDKIDVLIICGGSATDLPKQTPEYAKMFNVIDSFDTHARIPEHFDSVDAAAKESGHIGIISVGWDPGMFSLNRLYANAILTNGKDKPGDYVKKPMRDCTGREICMEWLYHIGVPEEDIAELAEHSANTVPVMMPYIDAFFMPRAFGDRPDIVPQGAVNFAFLGQFAETGRDTIFTTEYSMRTGMEAVYTLLNIDRGVPEVWGSTYDVRSLIDATVKLRDGKKITDMDLPFIQRVALKEVLKKIEGTDLEKILKEYNAI